MLRTLSMLVVASVAVLAGPAPVSAPAPAPVPGGGAVLAMHRELLGALDAGDVQAAQGFLSADSQPESAEGGRPCTLFLVGADGSPVSAVGNGESRALLARFLAEQTALGGKFETRITRAWTDCPSAEVSWAVLEFERAHSEDGAVRTRRYRSTSIVRHDDGWKLTAWHVSPADAPSAGIAAAK